MPRRFNYTGRKKISRSDVGISILRKEGKIPEFRAELDLSRYGLPDDAPVFVEAYRQSSWMRFDYGTVGSVVEPEIRGLTEFDDPDDIRFRVKITSSETPHGRLVAIADRLRPKPARADEEGRVPLLPVKREDLNGEIWRVEITDMPRLLVSHTISDKHAVARSPEFLSLVYPAAFRVVLSRVLIIENHRDTEDSDDWKSLWLRFATGLLGSSAVLPDEDGSGAEEWIDNAVSAFSRQHKVTTRFAEIWKGGAEE
jgi:hypothetical protein